MSLWLAGRISPQGHGERHQPGERHGDLRLRRGTPGRKGRKRIEKTHQPELSDLFPDGSFLGGGLPIGRQRAGPGNALPDAHGGRQRKPDRDPLRAGGRGGDARFQRAHHPDRRRAVDHGIERHLHLHLQWRCDPAPDRDRERHSYRREVHVAYASNAPRHDPFDNGAQPATTLLQSVQVTGLSGSKHQFEYSTGAGEMAKATMPLGGELAWTYGTFVYSGPRQYREAQTRPMRPSTGGALYTWNITHDSNTAQPYWTTVADTGAKIFGCVGVVWAAAFYFWYRDNPLQKPKMNGAERELLRQSSKMASGARRRSLGPYAGVVPVVDAVLAVLRAQLRLVFQRDLAAHVSAGGAPPGHRLHRAAQHAAAVHGRAGQPGQRLPHRSPDAQAERRGPGAAHGGSPRLRWRRRVPLLLHPHARPARRHARHRHGQLLQRLRHARRLELRCGYRRRTRGYAVRRHEHVGQPRWRALAHRHRLHAGRHPQQLESDLLRFRRRLSDRRGVLVVPGPRDAVGPRDRALDMTLRSGDRYRRRPTPARRSTSTTAIRPSSPTRR